MPEPLAIGSTRVIGIVRFHADGDLAGTLAAPGPGGGERPVGRPGATRP
jgi:hypothetical protein